MYFQIDQKDPLLSHLEHWTRQRKLIPKSTKRPWFIFWEWENLLFTCTDTSLPTTNHFWVSLLYLNSTCVSSTFTKDVLHWEIVWLYLTSCVKKWWLYSFRTHWNSVARSYVWWPKIDEAIEEVCKACYGCRGVQNAPLAAPVHPPFHHAMFLIVVDAYSKWPDIFEMGFTTSTATIKTLRTLFARQGIPAEIVLDNGPQFRSEKVRQFMESNSIRDIISSPFHPRTIGKAERFVQLFKKAIKSASGDPACINKKQFISVRANTVSHQGNNEWIDLHSRVRSEHSNTFRHHETRFKHNCNEQTVRY